MESTPPWLVQCRDPTGRSYELGVAIVGQETVLLLPDNRSLLLDPGDGRLLARGLVIATSLALARRHTVASGSVLDGGWRPAIFTRRRHFVPDRSPERPCMGHLIGTGLCGFPGYVDDPDRPGWRDFPHCTGCQELHDWLGAEDQKGSIPTPP